MRRRLFLALTLGLSGIFDAAVVLAQSGPDNDPDVAPGFVNSVFHHEQVDSINLYNGQLTIPILLGPSYPVGPSLKFQAVLTFNSKTTDYGHPTTQADGYVYQPFAGNPALGLGWEFTLGAIKLCKQGNTAGLCYFGPDGSQHIFSQGAKTGDGSQLLLSGSGPYDMWDGDGNHYVFGWQVSGFDDWNVVAPGYIHDFGRGRDGWYLTSVTDPFGNSYSVGYHTVVPPCWRYGAPAGGACALGPTMSCPSAVVSTWIPRAIFLPTATVQVLLDTQGSTANMISAFVFPVSRGGAATWSLSYEQAWDDFHTCSSSSIYLPVEVQRLTRIQLPAELGGSPAYEFSYSCPLTMKLPTGATIAYSFGTYTFYHGRAGAVVSGCQGMTPQNVPYVDVSFPTSSCPFRARSTPALAPDSFVGSACTADNEARWMDTVVGVVRRTETVPGAGGALATVATTDYTQYSFPYGEQGTSAAKQTAQTLTVVLLPADADNRRRAKAVLFHGTPKGQGVSVTLYNAPGDRVGADVEERIFAGDPNNTATGISTATPACSGGAGDQPFCSSRAVRVVRRTYEYDDCNGDGFPGGTDCREVGNRRLQSETTCYGPATPAGSCSTGLAHTVSRSNLAGRDWDSANGRHYNIEQHSGTLGSDARTTTTYWTPLVSPWLPNLLERRTDTMGSSVRDEFFDFDPTNGFSRGDFLFDAARQMVFLHCRYKDAAGSIEKDFSATYPGWPSAPRHDACSYYYPTYPTVAIGVNGDAFGKTYTYRNGLLLSARWMADPSTPAGWYTKNLFRDLTTGWILASTDSSLVTTNYFYDSVGRVTAIFPNGEAATRISYDSATQTTATRDGGPGLTSVQRYLYDGLGRVGREVRLSPGSSVSPYSVRRTDYDPAGHETFLSEWIGCGGLATCASAAVTAGTASSSFDPTGRPQSIRKADGATTTVSYADGAALYSVTSRSVTTGNVNGACSNGCAGGTSSTATFRYDAFERLTRVVEPGGADATDYAYDVNGKLVRVLQGVQTRTFDYDAAGNLRAEATPEKGSVGDDVYGSLGNVLSETEPGGLAVTRTYDFAGRLTGVVSAGQRYLTNCYDGAACADGNPGFWGGVRPLGKLTRRIGFNPLSPTAPIVTDDLEYSDSAGKLSSQTTSVSGGSSLTATQRWQYNGLGLVAHHYHPRSDGSSPFAVSIDYDAGLPVAEYVNGIPMVTGTRYQPGGTLWTYTTGIGIGHDVTAQVLEDASSLLPRPARIFATAQGVSTPAFDTLNYGYDGAGNIVAMGPDTFSYDNRSRLVAANLSGIGSQAYSYDRYGNLLSQGNTSYSISPYSNRVSTLTYDARGNVTGNGTETYSYDGLDRQIGHANGASVWSYVFDGGNERLGKIPPSGSWTCTVRDEAGRIATEFVGTDPTRDNLYLGNRLVVSSGDPRLGGNDRSWTFYVSDHVGSPRLITDIAGAMVESPKHWPFGASTAAQGSFQRIRFASMERDTEASRYQDHARSHDFSLARFLTPDRLMGDTVSPQSWNRYQYALNNPVLYTDPLGLAPEDSTDSPVVDPCETRPDACTYHDEIVVTAGEPGLIASFVLPYISFVTGSDNSTVQLAKDIVRIGMNSVPLKGLGIERLGAAGRGAAELLPARVAARFSGNVHRLVLKSNVIAYRYWGGSSDKLGHWLTTEGTVSQIGSALEAQIALKLPAGATAEQLTGFVIPRGTEIFIGRVAGGALSATQIWVRDVARLLSIP